MQRALLLAGLLVLPAVSAQAQNPGGYFGFYQPYGLRTDTLTPTPPYFAIHPPVYYGQRYSRPYGISPFPAMPELGVPADYKAIRRSDPIALPQLNPHCQQCTTKAADVESGTVAEGSIQTNPFVESTVRMASGPSI
jgi:hypothetical protein